MKKFLIALVALLALLFYTFVSTYTFNIYNSSNGYVLTDSSLREQLFSSEEGRNIQASEVKAGEGIYTRGKTVYFGDQEKVKVNTAFPLYVKNGEAIQLLSGNETLITTEYKFKDTFKYSILSDGRLFNETYQEADGDDYLLVHLSNNLYVNTKELNIKTVLHEYTIPENSIIYFNSEYIRYYKYFEDEFIYESIVDIDYESTVSAEFTDNLSYRDFLLKLGEIVEYSNSEYTGKGKKEPNVNKDVEDNKQQSQNQEIVSSDSKPKKIEQNEHNTKADEPAPPEEADPTEQKEMEIKYPDWVKPEVSLNGVFNPGVYTLKVGINVNDPAGVIARGVSFYVYYDDPINKGKEATSQLVRTYDPVVTAIINNLIPETEYTVKANYRYYDKYGRIQDEVQVFDSKSFKTKTLADLGAIEFAAMDAKSNLFDNKIQVNNIKFNTTSDQDAVGSLFLVTARTYEGRSFYGKQPTTSEGFISGSQQLSTLCAYDSISYTTPNTLKSSEDYLVVFECRDRYGNVIKANNDSILTRTCKSLPTASLLITNPYDDHNNIIVSSAIITNSIKNEDVVDYENLRVKITDSKGNILKNGDLDYYPVEENSSIQIDNLTLSEKYTVTLLCDADNDDGKGKTTRTLDLKEISTFYDYGNIYLNGTNLTKTHYTDYTADRVVFTLGFNDNRTNTQLISLIEELYFTITDNKGSVYITHYLTEEELTRLKNLETVTFDSYELSATKLPSNTTYSISYTDTRYENGKAIHDTINPSFSTFVTSKLFPVCYAENIQGFAGYLAADLMVADVDDYIEGNNVLVRVRSKQSNKIIGSFSIPKNDNNYYELRLYSDASSSPDGMTYDIEGNSDYFVYFIAEEVTDSIDTFVILDSFSINTAAGVTGNIYLKNFGSYFTSQDGQNLYQQLDYIGSTGTQWINTGINGKNITRFALEGYCESNSSYNTQLIGGTEYDNNTFFGNMNSNYWYAYNSSNTTILSASKWGEFDITTVSPTSNYGTARDVETGQIYEVARVRTSNWGFGNETLRVFSGESRRIAKNAKIRYLKLYTADGLARDFVPARNAKTGEIGLYDFITDTLFTNSGTGTFVAGGSVSKDNSRVNNVDNFAFLNIDIQDNDEWLFSKTVYIDVFKNNDVKGQSNLVETLQYKYTGKGSYIDPNDETSGIKPIDVIYKVDILSDPSDYYFMKLYIKLDNGSIIPISNASFSTNEPISEISSIADLYNIGTSKGKYVVTKNLYINATTHPNEELIEYSPEKPYDTSRGSWTKANASPWYSDAHYLNAQIDFQGFTFEYHGYSSLFTRLSADAKISNIVLKTFAYYTRTAQVSSAGTDVSYNNCYAAAFIRQNYGTIENAYIEMYQEDISQYYKYSSYWCSVPYATGVTKYDYFKCNNFVVNNYGLITNFVANYKTENLSSVCGGLIGVNTTGGIIRNGYLYSDLYADEEHEYNYKAQLFAYNGYNDAANYYNTNSAIASRNMAATIENIYCLADIDAKHTSVSNYVGIITAYNYSGGIVRNTYVIGNVLRNGQPNNPNYGPSIGVNTAAVRHITENYYISDYTYYSTRNSSTDNTINKPTGYVALKDTEWQTRILNTKNDSFSIKDLISAGYYPHLNYTSNVMPSQVFIPIPSIKKTDTDVTLTYEHKWGINLDLDEELKEGIRRELGADFDFDTYLGDLVWDQLDENGLKSQVKVEVGFVVNKSLTPIYGLEMFDREMVVRTIKEFNDGSGITQCYFLVYNPNEALSTYAITGVQWTNPRTGQKGDTVKIKNDKDKEITRDLDIKFYRAINGVEGDESWQKLRENTKQNFRLYEDLDFGNYNLDKIFVYNYFEGELDGNGHTIKNVELREGQFNDYITSQSTQGTVAKSLSETSIINDYSSTSYTQKTGIFSTIYNGTIENITFENINIEYGFYAGAICGYSNGALFSNVFVNDAYVVGVSEVGGFVGMSIGTEIIDSGINNAKIMSIAGGSYAGGMTYVDPSRTASIAGGLIGYGQTASKVTRSYANNIYIENLTSDMNYGYTGGIVGGVNDSCEINGVYATGVIVSSVRATGGIVGQVDTQNNTRFIINNCYSDVDILGYNGSVGGIIGDSRYTFNTDGMNVVFGDIFYNTTRDDLTTVKSKYSLTTAYKNGLNAFTCDSANLVISSNDITPGTSFNKSIINSQTIFESGYMSSEYFSLSSTPGVLPKLLGTDNKVLPNQMDNYIDAYNSDISIDNNNSMSYDHSNETKNIVGYQFGFNTDPSVTINKVYFDYSYIDDCLGLNSDYIVDSLTSHHPFKGGQASDNRSPAYYSLRLTDGDIASFYDYYRLTAIKYTKKNADGTSTTNYLRLNKLLDIDPKEMKVSGLSDWNNYVANSRAENISLIGDVNFNAVYNYKNKNVNIIVNKLIGPIDKATISNLTINGSYDFSTNKGYLYDFSASLIKASLSEMRNIVFDNITVERNRQCGIVHEVRGIVDNVDFTNCYVGSSSSYTYMPDGLGLIDSCSAVASNIYVDNCNVVCPSAYGVGIVFGSYNENFYSNSAKNILIENSYCFGSTYVGGLVGFVHNFSCDSSGETKTTFDNIVIRNSKVIGNGNGVGGFIGIVYFPHYMHYLENSLIDNCYIQSVTGSYVGGAIGYCDYILYARKNTINASTIKGLNRVGGFSGYAWLYPNSTSYSFDNTIANCQIVGTGDYVAGAVAYNAYADGAAYYTDRTMYDNPETTFYRYYVNNSEIIGNRYVAGVYGYCTSYDYISNNIVDNCTIKANQTAGGIFAFGPQVALSSIVSNSYIGPFESAADASKYGIAYTPGSNFGGIVGTYGGYANCIVQNCIIGGPTVNRVGGLSGMANMSRNSLQQLTNSICKDTIVIGNDCVGGLFGSLGRNDQNYYAYATNLYSNALVYANDHAGGIAGKLTSYYDSSDKEYKNMPTVENVYFTGTINSNNNASLLYGQVVGNTTLTCDWLRYVSSLPKSVTCKTFTPFFAEDDEYSYLWANLINTETNTSNMLVSFYGGTSVTDQYGTKTLSSILTSTSGIYNNYCYEDSDTIVFVNSNNASKFIRIYNSDQDIVSKFHSELINPAKSSLSSSYRYVGFATNDIADYMPLVVATNTSTKTIFVNPNSIEIAPISGVSIINKATGDFVSYSAMQGVYIPGTTLYDDIVTNLENRHDTFTASGAAAVGIGCSGIVGVPSPYDDGVYYAVEYIGSNAKQYIDTGYTISTGYSFDFEWQINDQTNWYIGANSSDYEMIIGRKTSNYFGTKYRGFNYSWKYGEKSHIRMDLANGSTNSQLYENGTLIADVASAFNNKELYLFGVISGSSATTCDSMKTMRYYYFDIYQGEEKVMALIPVVTESGLGGMYDTIGKKFYPSETSTPFFYGKKLSDTPINAPLTMMMAPKSINNITAYASDVDTLNIEFSTNYYNASKDKNPYIEILDINDNVLIEKEILNNFTYAIKYDFDTVIQVKYGYDGVKESSYTVDPVQVSNHVMLTDNSTYAIYDHKLYINDVSNNTITNPVHLDNGLCIDKNGNIYNLTSMNIISSVNSISKTNAIPLYTFSYDSRDIYSYVYRTVVSSNSGITVQDGTRSFVAYGNLISLVTNSDVASDPLYVLYKNGKDYTILLKKNSLYSIGDSNLISKLENFTNEGIKAISSNIGISSTNKNLLVEYKNGSIIDINTETGEITNIGESVVEEETDVISFLSKSLTSMFSMPTTSSYNLTNNHKASNTIINYMDSAGASIPDIVNLINDNEVSNIADTVILGTTYGIGNSGGDDQVGLPEDSKINEGEGSESSEILPSENENPTTNTLEEMISIIDDKVSEDNKAIIANYEKVLMDTAKKAIENTLSLDSTKANTSEFVSVYNADTDSFEIFNENEFLSDKNAESIDSMIVDKTKLRTLYNELGQANDNTTTRGIILYGIIAIIIIILLSFLSIFKNKVKN